MLEFVTQPIGNYGPLTWTALTFVIVLVVLLGLGLWLMQASLFRRLTLVTLRAVAIALLLFAMLQPTLIYTRTEKSRATIAVLLDRSRSMQIVDGAGGKSRWELMTEAIHKALPEFTALETDLDIKYYTFDGRALPVEMKDGKLNLPAEPDGQESAYGQAIDEVRRLEQQRQPLKAMFLLGDGAQRTAKERSLPPQAAAGRLRNLGIPLYTVALGENRSQEQSRDLAITELNVSPTVFVKNELAVTGMVRAMGFVNQPIKVELLYEVNGKLQVVDSETVKAADHGVELRVDLSYVPEVAGEHKLALRAVPHPSERVVMNNELATFITVLKGGVRVLYVEGRPRMEQKYIRWALGASPNIQVDYFEVDAGAPQPLPADASEWFQKGKYDAYILGDVDASAFKDEQMLALRERIKEGSGLMMLGGFNSFGAGGYQRTWLYLDKSRPTNRAADPNAEFDFLPSPVVPVKMLATERQDLGEKVIVSLHLAGSQKVVPTESGQRHYLLQLTDRAQNDDLWKRLPPWEGANRFRGLTSLARILARNPQGEPLLVESDFGLGRVVAMAGDSTWRWWMRGFQKEHRRFWRQVVLYLVHKDETDESGVWVRLPRRRFNKNDRVEITAGLQTPEGEPITTATLQGEVLLPDGKKQTFPLVRQTVDFAGMFGESVQAGDYTVTVTATQTNGETGSARARFIVRDTDLELDNPAAEPGVLSSLAAMTSGKMLAPEQLRGVLEELRAQPLGLEEQKPTKVELWDNWLVLLAFVAALGLEWFLRKRWGLV